MTLFRYKLTGGRLSPIITAGIKLAGAWHRVEMYVDSGAAYTILRARFATDLGFDFTAGRRISVQVGDGEFIPVFLHKLPLQIGARRLNAQIGFSDKLGVRFHLLGRQDVFEQFKVCFHEKRRLVSFAPVA